MQVCPTGNEAWLSFHMFWRRTKTRLLRCGPSAHYPGSVVLHPPSDTDITKGPRTAALTLWKVAQVLWRVGNVANIAMASFFLEGLTKDCRISVAIAATVSHKVVLIWFLKSGVSLVKWALNNNNTAKLTKLPPRLRPPRTHPSLQAFSSHLSRHQGT